MYRCSLDGTALLSLYTYLLTVDTTVLPFSGEKLLRVIRTLLGETVQSVSYTINLFPEHTVRGNYSGREIVPSQHTAGTPAQMIKFATWDYTCASPFLV